MKYKKPERKHEDNLKVELFVTCKHEGIKLELEYGYKNCRFDGVVVRQGRILAIVEIKNWTIQQAMKNKRDLPEQLKKYRKFGIPVLVLWSFNGIYRAMERIKELALFHDCGDRRILDEVVFYPRAKKSGRRKKNEELAKLIKQQANNVKYNSRMFSSNHRTAAFYINRKIRF